MHDTQAKLLTLAKRQKNLGKLSLRQIAKFIDAEGRPQVVKYHLRKLEEAGLIKLNLTAGVIKPVTKGVATRIRGLFFSVPIVGAANCGPATIFADERTEGYLQVSEKFLQGRKKGLYALVADGPSMNRAVIHDGQTLEDGDFALVDSTYRTPEDGDVVVAVIDGMATIKRYIVDDENDRIILQAESTENYYPIILHESDDFTISGKVIGVIKK